MASVMMDRLIDAYLGAEAAGGEGAAEARVRANRELAGELEETGPLKHRGEVWWSDGGSVHRHPDHQWRVASNVNVPRRGRS